MRPEIKLDELLPKVQRPGRYIGGEWNAVRKEWSGGRVKILLAFPDLYEVGMSHLGMKILYALLNDRDDCLCERVFSPWQDFEGILRANKTEIFSLESRRPISRFDIIGFSLTYELAFTNMLNILDLGNIPKRASDRGGEYPLVIAGGPACLNPEPIADFMDAILIGEGEEAIVKIVEAYKTKKPKRALLKNLAAIEGMYVPSLYGVEYNDDKTIKAFAPKEEGIKPRIRKRIVNDLDSVYYPTRQIVPNIPIVHDRIALEIMRGCPNACKFCQATSIYRPCRKRTSDTVLRLAREAYAMTGYDEISLLSLSSGDHPQIKDMIKALNEEFEGKGVSISVPSLRIEDFLKGLPTLLSKVKKPGLTFAPESGNDTLRRSMNKGIDIDKLFASALESFRAGWRRVKLYFMIGLPNETQNDVSDIIELIYKISNLKEPVDGKKARVAVSVNAFVPKPHTPFQREAMDRVDVLEGKRNLLRQGVRSKMIELDFHSFQMSYLEAVFSRGDRRLAEVVHEAWRSGARFDGWGDLFRFDIWLNAFERTGVDPSFYIYRKRPPDEILPWDFIDL